MLWAKVVDGMSAIRLRVGVGIAGMAALDGGTQINIPDAYQDKRFNSSFDKKSGYITRSILCIPVKLASGRLVAVLQCINKLDGIFNGDDEILLQMFCRYVAGKIELNLDTDEDRDEGAGASSIQHDGIRPAEIDAVLSDVNRWKRTKKRALEDQAAFLQYLKIINQEARDIVGCDRATLFLVDAFAKVVFAKVVEGMPPIRVPFGVGFAGSAAEGGGILINVTDAYDDERFNPACKLCPFHRPPPCAQTYCIHIADNYVFRQFFLAVAFCFGSNMLWLTHFFEQTQSPLIPTQNHANNYT